MYYPPKLNQTPPPPFWEPPGLVGVCAPKSDRNRNIPTPLWPPPAHMALQ